MATFTIHSTTHEIPNTAEQFTALVATLAEQHAGLRNEAMTFFLRREDTGEVVASMVGEGKYGTLHLLFEAMKRPSLSAGYVEMVLNSDIVASLFTAFTPFHAEQASHPNVAFLSAAKEAGAPVRCGIVSPLTDALKGNAQYLKYRTTLMFDLFNDGALRGLDGSARQALLDSFSFLPNRVLTAEGAFAGSEGAPSTFLRAFEPGAGEEAARPHGWGGIDKFPSLMAVRGARLKADMNRIVPSAMIRDGVYIGKRNIFMFHAAVNIAAYIGDDNLIDSHASIASAAQIGNRNKIGSFVSFEGVLSPANAQPVIVGDDNFFGTFARVGTGITIGNNNFIGAGVNISRGTKLHDCRAGKGGYLAVQELNGRFDNLVIVPNNAPREFNGVQLLPGEYALFENSEEFIKRFEGDTRIKAS